jgi:peptide/nickel transport system permease protein
MTTDLDQTPDGAGNAAESFRQQDIAEGAALTHVSTGRSYTVGTTIESDFIDAESGEEHAAWHAEGEVKARGYWEGIWLRLKKDKLAIVGGIFIIILFVVAFAGAPIAAKLIGHGPNEPFFSTGGVDSSLLPAGPMTHVQKLTDSGQIEDQLLILGADSTLGRDEFLRILYGAQVSLEVGVGATFIAMMLGLLLGSIAGFYRGYADTIISRVTEITMAFPYLLFVIALASTVGTRLDKVTFGFLGEGVLTLVIVFGLFSWFYSARVFRGITLSLREKEFVEAARMVGASDGRIVRSHIVPHLMGPLIVFSTLNIAAFILAEAGLSFLGLGIKLPTASWGTLLAQAPSFYTSRPLLMVWPGIALLLTTLAFNLLGDGLRDAFDPRASR